MNTICINNNYHIYYYNYHLPNNNLLFLAIT